MYLVTPSFELSLDEFEEYALARLKVCWLCDLLRLLVYHEWTWSNSGPSGRFLI